VTGTEPTPDLATEVRTTLRLLIEYTDKLRRWVEEARPLTDVLNPLSDLPTAEEQVAELTDRYERIRPACHDLSRMASGLIEQSRADYTQRTELRLRLAEFENALVTLGKLLAPEPPTRRRKK
jgi:hypothetical protein